MSAAGAEDDYEHSPPGLGGGGGDDESPTTSEASGLGQAAADLEEAIAARPTRSTGVAGDLRRGLREAEDELVNVENIDQVLALSQATGSPGIWQPQPEGSSVSWDPTPSLPGTPIPRSSTPLSNYSWEGTFACSTGDRSIQSSRSL